MSWGYVVTCSAGLTGAFKMIGKTISHYKILEKLGEGGMGVVYKARDTKLDRDVALKFLPNHLSVSRQDKARFIHEAKAASALDHPNICTVHEIDESPDGQLFIVMSYYDRETLKKKIEQGPLRIEEAVDISIQIAQGLAKAHEHGIVHRDIKPANVMVTRDGVAKIVDFGLAKLGGQTVLTKTGTTIGTVAYMSPEQASGHKIDHRTDIWSLGVVLYEMIIGQRPFKSEYEQAAIYSILNEEPEPLRKLNSSVPAELEQVVGQTLAKEPANRYQTMEEFLCDMRAVAGGLKPLKARRRGKRFRLNATILLPAFLTVLLVLFGINIGGLRDQVFGGKERTVPAIKLAVLPFANLTGDPEQEYLNDGLTQEMINRLGRLHPTGLNVIARTSVMRYKDTDTPVDQIGRELGVDYVLEGSAQREEGRVRVIAGLIQVKNQMQLWTETYERETSGILALQSEVARRVAGALALKLLPREQARLAGVRTVDPEAYEAYLKAVHYREQLTRESYDAAERYFNLALEKDPNYAAAWAGLSRIWGGREQLEWATSQEASHKAKAAALKALALDDTETEAHRALAGILTWEEWDWEAAERAWKRVLELDPGHADALASYSHFLMHMGRKEEAMKRIEKAMELDPFNVKIMSFYAMDLDYAYRYDEAIAAARKILSWQPNTPVARVALMTALFATGRYDENLAAERERCTGDRVLIEALDRGYTEGGFTGAKKRLADTLAARYGKPGGVSSFHLANLYLHAGDRDQVFKWLERAYAEHNRSMPYLRLHFNSLRSDPRFQNLVRRVGLPTENNEKSVK
jgi:TolB-like protein/tRNA A-37 threonylcarbamoyl transferase component Bud32/Tfp pilus assembly protein PilF